MKSDDSLSLFTWPDFLFLRLVTVALFMLLCQGMKSIASTTPRPNFEGKISYASNISSSPDSYEYALYTTPLIPMVTRRLTDLKSNSLSPCYSPDGKKVVFAALTTGRNSDIFIMNSNGGELKRLTDYLGWDGQPSFDSTGGNILYSSNHKGTHVLVAINLKEGRTIQLPTKQFNVEDATYMPDSTHVLFSALPISGDASTSHGQSPQIYTMHLNGSQIKSLGIGRQPCPSHDGKSIVFVNDGLWVMDSDGRNRRRITGEGADDSTPCFSPDDRTILFASRPSERSARAQRLTPKKQRGNSDIYLASLDGKVVRRLTDGPGDKRDPVWVPTTSPIDSTSLLKAKSQASYTLKKISQVDSKNWMGDMQVPSSGHLLCALNKLDKAPFPSFLTDYTSNKSEAFRIDGLQGTDGDLVFEPLILPRSGNVLVKIGEPSPRAFNSFDFYRLWLWSRPTNTFKQVSSRSLYFPTLAVSPDGLHVAYVGGGTAEGDVSDGETLSLYICDLRTAKETLVTRNNGVRGGFAWLNAQTLLYTVVPQAKASQDGNTVVRPNLMAFDLTTGQSRLWMADGAHPCPAPDGKHVAFFGLRRGEKLYPLPEPWWTQPGIMALSVANGDGSGRKSYGVRSGPYPSLSWAPDNVRLLFVRQSEASEQATIAEVGEWNVVNDDTRTIGTLKTSGSSEEETSWRDPFFRALSTSKDGQTLYVAVKQAPEEAATTVQTLQAVSLQTGQATILSRLKNVDGFSWTP